MSAADPEPVARYAPGAGTVKANKTAEQYQSQRPFAGSVPAREEDCQDPPGQREDEEERYAARKCRTQLATKICSRLRFDCKPALVLKLPSALSTVSVGDRYGREREEAWRPSKDVIYAVQDVGLNVTAREFQFG